MGHSAGSIRRELLKFTKDDLFHTRRVGNLLYYYLNTEHPLYEEIKNIVSKTVGVEGRLRKALSTIKEIDTAFIYGSFASGNEKSTSDVDLMLIGDPEISFLNEKIAELEKILQREVNISVYSSEEYMHRKRENSGFVMDVLNNPKIMLIGKEDDL